MGTDSRKAGIDEAEVVFGEDTIEQEMRKRVREVIRMIVEEELESALGARRSQRVGDERLGYRNGSRSRQITTSLGKTTIEMPRARISQEDGATREWSSQVVPRYQRRTRRVDEAILGVYVGGTNTRRIKGALSPLVSGAPLSKDAVSRLVARLKHEFGIRSVFRVCSGGDRREMIRTQEVSGYGYEARAVGGAGAPLAA